MRGKLKGKLKGCGNLYERREKATGQCIYEYLFYEMQTIRHEAYGVPHEGWVENNTKGETFFFEFSHSRQLEPIFRRHLLIMS